MDGVLPLLIGLASPELSGGPPEPSAGAALAGPRVDVEGLERVAARIRARSGLVIPVNGPVIAALERLIGEPQAQAWTMEGLERGAALLPRLRPPLEAEGVPPELAAIPLIESSFRNLGEDELDPGALNGARPAGLWMFLPATGRTHGLRVDALLDERMSEEKETAAAAHLLAHLHRTYGDWGLALSAYNQGSERLDAAIARGGTRDVWALIARGFVNDYPARVFAAALLLEEPALLGPPPAALDQR